MPVLYSLPPELLTHIFSLTPTSYPSLSLLSRSFHALSSPFALHTLHVSGLQSIRRLISLLDSDKSQAEAEGRTYVGRVKHIFLCDVAPETANVPGIDDILRRSGPDIFTQAHGLLQAYTALLPLLAPSLVSLTVLSYNPHITPYRVILDTPFPRLQSLTMRFTAIPYTVDIDMDRVTMPSLTHLHLAFAAPPTLCDKPIGLVDMAAACAPDLREVKLTNVRLGRNSVGAMRKMLAIGRAVNRARVESVLTLFGENEDATELDLDPGSDTTSVVTDVDSDDSTDVEDETQDLRLAALRNVYIQPSLSSNNIPWWSAYQREMVEELKTLSRQSVYECARDCVDGHKRGKLGEREREARQLVVLEPGRTAGAYCEWREKWSDEVGWEPDFGVLYGVEEELVKVESVEGRVPSPTSPWRMH